MRGYGFLVFLLMLALILVVYYIGASTDFASFSNGSRQILYALSGRNTQGNYPGYPSGGGGLAPGVLG